MKKSELKLLIENQRKILVSLEYYFLTAGYLPSNDESLQYHLHNLWEITDIIDDTFDLDLMSLADIIKDCQLKTGIQNMHQTNTNDTIN